MQENKVVAMNNSSVVAMNNSSVASMGDNSIVDSENNAGAFTVSTKGRVVVLAIDSKMIRYIPFLGYEISRFECFWDGLLELFRKYPDEFKNLIESACSGADSGSGDQH